ncbi:uncharacterized protein ARMOST_15781 [Armillaria ostoyae]|uniref:Uncharacterized protein n=1 Tax=Armillaria ostoyae TaxID=47428 RepID=A0A284RUG1_ARMOS|nr:uncharacterized protein ARMOST_15781 [Armillaria ostoyae]
MGPILDPLSQRHHSVTTRSLDRLDVRVDWSWHKLARTTQYQLTFLSRRDSKRTEPLPVLPSSRTEGDSRSVHDGGREQRANTRDDTLRPLHMNDQKMTIMTCKTNTPLK